MVLEVLFFLKDYSLKMYIGSPKYSLLSWDSTKEPFLATLFVGVHFTTGKGQFSGSFHSLLNGDSPGLGLIPVWETG